MPYQKITVAEANEWARLACRTDRTWYRENGRGKLKLMNDPTHSSDDEIMSDTIKSSPPQTPPNKTSAPPTPSHEHHRRDSNAQREAKRPRLLSNTANEAPPMLRSSDLAAGDVVRVLRYTRPGNAAGVFWASHFDRAEEVTYTVELRGGGTKSGVAGKDILKNNQRVLIAFVKSSNMRMDGAFTNVYGGK